MTLFGDVRDPRRYVYHYTTAQALLEGILPTRTIRFGLARNTNDPRDAKAWWFSLRGGDAESLPLEDVIEAATNRFQRTAKLLCLTNGDPERAHRASYEAFGRGYAHAAMWAHYAGGHSGACLVFERNALRDRVVDECSGHSNWVLYEGDVDYTDYGADEIDAFSLDYGLIQKVGLEPALDAHVEKYNGVLFFRKNTDWADECEFRWLILSPEPAPAFIPIGDSLRAIVVGESFPSDSSDSLKYLATQAGNPTIARCFWRNGLPRVVPAVAGVVSLDGIRFWPRGANPQRPPPSRRVMPRED